MTSDQIEKIGSVDYTSVKGKHKKVVLYRTHCSCSDYKDYLDIELEYDDGLISLTFRKLFKVYWYKYLPFLEDEDSFFDWIISVLNYLYAD